MKYEVWSKGEFPTPYSLLPTPYSLLPTPYSLLLTPYSLLLTPYSLLPTPYSLLLNIVDRLAKNAVGGFHDGFVEGWVGVHRVGDFVGCEFGGAGQH